MIGSRTPLYLDHQATTPVDPIVLETMLPYFKEHFGNPSSQSHSYGWTAQAAVKTARKQVALLLGAEPEEIIFTSGATESNNLSIFGLAKVDARRHFVTCATEHHSVLGPIRELESQGYRVTVLMPKSNGILDVQEVSDAITSDTLMVSIMAVNNEIGVIQPLKEIGAICEKKGVFFHTDAVQAIGHIPFNVQECRASLASITAHKIYGPKGVGALYIRRKNPRVTLKPQVWGGGQENGLRAGTLAVPLIVGFGKACEIAVERKNADRVHFQGLSSHLMSRLTTFLPGIKLNGDHNLRISGNLNLCFPDLSAEMLMSRLKGVALSAGSACLGEDAKASHVLTAIGLSPSEVKNSVRIGFGRGTTLADIDWVVEEIYKIYRTKEKE